MKKWRYNMLLVLLIVIVSLIAGGYLYLQHPKFGKLPEGDVLKKINQSPNYSNGSFQNLAPIPQAMDKSSMLVNGIKYLFTKGNQQTSPPASLPTVKTNLLTLNKNEDTVIWLGHSSYFIQLNGKRILIDPVFSTNASPVPFTNVAFEGTNIYTAEDIPDIDYLLISHDHWDHLDYPTIIAVKNKIKNVIVGLGVGSHFRHWGYSENSIHEKDWNELLQFEDNFTIHVLPARHFSGRTFTGNKTLWVSFALITPNQKLYFSGDSGYGPHFLAIGQQFGGFNLVILDSGQYNENWQYVHMTPEEAAQATQDLQSQTLLPAHIAKFSLAYHSWNDPLIRSFEVNKGQDYRLFTPKIGEPVLLNNSNQTFAHWWENINDSDNQ